MYEEFFSYFGLQRNPFHASSDPQFFFSTAANDAALAQLVFGIESRQGIVLLTGEPGTGKTTLLHCLLNWLRLHSYSSSYVFHSLLSSAGLLEMILRDFGISCASRAKSGLLAALEEWLLRRHKSGDCPVIVIDEAQALSTRALEELRMLLNLEIPGAKLVQIVLAGQPALEEKLRRPGLEQLRRRIMFHCKLPVLTPEETGGYIASRLAQAGAPKSELFPEDVVGAVFAHSQGVPRIINQLCEHALLAAYADRRDSVSRDDILQISKQFDLGREAEPEPGQAFYNTFGRLIPFPTLSSAEAMPPLPKIEPELLLDALMPKPVQPLGSLEPVAPKPVWPPLDSPVPAMAPVNPPVLPRPAPAAVGTTYPAALGTSHFLSYWRAIGQSLARDCRAFFNSFTAWLGGSSRQLARSSPRPLNLVVSPKLEQPVSSLEVPADLPRASSGSRKNL
jgi:general secretion pathway protein A